MTTLSSRPTTSPGSATAAAPLDPEEVRLTLADFGESRMLPRAAYLDEAVLAWEQQHVFGGWVGIGRAEQVRRPRSAAAYRLAGGSVLVTRDREGVLHAFENACRHRGHELLPCGGTSDKRLVSCPYHAWTYDHRGDLRTAPGYPRDGSFDTSGYSLRRMPVQEWHGWLFVDPSHRAGPFAEHVGDLEQVLAPYDAGRLRTAVTHEYDVASNWKVVVENYMECYHCPSIHPELCRVSPPRSGENLEPDGDWVGGWMDLREGAATMSLDGGSAGVVIPGLPEQEARTVMYLAVLPNLLISLHPDYVMTHLLTPVEPGVTHISCSWAFREEAVAADGFDPSYAVDFWDLTNKQDWSACESVQRGIHAPGFVPGPLAPEEDGVYQFVTKLARAYLA